MTWSVPATLIVPQGFFKFGYKSFNESNTLLLYWENPKHQVNELLFFEIEFLEGSLKLIIGEILSLPVDLLLFMHVPLCGYIIDLRCELYPGLQHCAQAQQKNPDKGGSTQGRIGNKVSNCWFHTFHRHIPLLDFLC